MTNLVIDASDLFIPTILDKAGKNIIYTENATATTGGTFYDPDGPVLMSGNDRASKIYSYDTVSGKWLALKYTVSFESNGGSSISDERVFHEYDFTEPDNPIRYGYVFEGWFMCPEFIVAYDFSTPVVSDLTLYAKWSPAFLSTITPSAEPEGWIDPSDPQEVPYDGFTFTFGANEGYRIKDVKVNGNSVPFDADSETLGTYSFRNVEHDVYTIHVEFEAYHSVTVNEIDNGVIEVSNSAPIHGDSVTITVRSNEGYTLEAFTDNNVDVISSVILESEGVWTYALSSVIMNHEIVVIMTKITYVMTVDYSGEGTIIPEDGYIVEHGDDLTFTFIPTEGYHISEVFADGISVDYNVNSNGVGTYSFFDIVDNHTFKVTFELNTYNVVLKSGTGYSLTPAEGATSPVYHRESFGIVFSLNEGYDKSKAVILVNGSMIAIIDGKHDVTIVVTSIIEDIVITVEDVVLNTYTVTVDLDDGFFDCVPDGWIKETDGIYTKEFVHNTSFSTILNEVCSPEKAEHSFDKFVPSSGRLETDGVIITTQWIINQYTATVDLNNGSFDTVPAGWSKESDSVYTKKFDYNTSYSDILDDVGSPTKTGHSFDGFTPSEGNLESSGAVFTALWDVNQYTISFDSNGGSVVDSIRQDYNTEITAPEDPTREGYTFDGWDISIPATMPAEDLEITATWTIIQYTATVDLVDGYFDTVPAGWVEESDGSYTKKFDYNTALSEIINDIGLPEKIGYDFDGFDPSEGNLGVTGVTLTAQWIAKKYTISFDTQGGTFVGMITEDYNTEVVLPDTNSTTKTGYTFDGWSLTSDGELVTVHVLTEDVMLYAIWTINQYAVTLTQGEGYTLVPAEGYSSPVDYTDSFAFVFSLDEGYDMSVALILMDGVELATVGGVHGTTIKLLSVTEDTVITVENVVINTYKAIVELDDGFFNVIPDGWVAESDGSYTKNFDHGTPYSAIINDVGLPGKTGYSFDGFTPSEGSFVTGVSFTAQWNTNEYTISFDSNGGSVVDSIKQNYGTPVTAPDDPVKYGYTFTGWDPAIPATMPGENVMLIATWDVNLYTITVTSKENIAFTYTIDNNDSVEFIAGPDEPYEITISHGSALIVQAMPEDEGRFRWVDTGAGTADGNILTIDAVLGNKKVGGYTMKETEIASSTALVAVGLSVIPLLIFGRRLFL